MDWISDLLSGLSLVAVIVIGWRSVLSSERSRKAAEKSTEVAEHAARDALREGRLRRVEGLLDVLLTMREMFNDQEIAAHEDDPNWMPGLHSPEALARLGLCRKLETRLVLFEGQADKLRTTQALSTTYLWSSGHLETAIMEAKTLMTEVAGPEG